MNDLALIAIGAILGMALALTAVMVYSLWITASGFKRTVNAALAESTKALTAQNAIVDKLRSEVALALSRMDAERLYEASLAVQRSSKAMAGAVATLTKAIYAQPAIDTGPETFGIEDEAEDDARMIAEHQRWAGADPLAGLSEEEKNRRVQMFFENRRRTQQGGISHLGSSPPVAGAGAYASLLDTQEPAPAKPPADFDDMMGEENGALDDKGEFGG
jgi:hypothetical protein